MPLYICDSCYAIENTIQGNYFEFFMKAVKKTSCSECLNGDWHNLFPKQIATLEIIKGTGLENFVHLGKFEKELKE
jgi:hypothetical protein